MKLPLTIRLPSGATMGSSSGMAMRLPANGKKHRAAACQESPGKGWEGKTQTAGGGEAHKNVGGR